MTPFLDFSRGQSSDPKMHLSIGELPGYIDPAQPSSKKSPWRQISNVPLVQSVTMIMPDEMYQLIWDRLEAESSTVRYAKVVMKLQDVLDGEFFTEYVKRGNVLMLSEGQPGVDNTFSLRDGVLRFDIDKDSHERAGLQGKVVRGGGRKHAKSRFLIEQDLRQPSMLHGKKGFERIVWAAKNVLNQSVVWLFTNLQDDVLSVAEQPIDKHHPTWVNMTPKLAPWANVPIPKALKDGIDFLLSKDDPDIYYDISEWLDLVLLDSNQITKSHNTDPYISRSAIPETSDQDQDLRVVRWHGLLGSKWVTSLIVNTIRQSRISHATQWMAFVVTAHHTEAVEQIDGYTIVMHPATNQDAREENEMDVSVPETSRQAEPNPAVPGGSREKGKLESGLRRHLCFEHVNAVWQRK